MMTTTPTPPSAESMALTNLARDFGSEHWLRVLAEARVAELAEQLAATRRQLQEASARCARLEGELALHQKPARTRKQQ